MTEAAPRSFPQVAIPPVLVALLCAIAALLGLRFVPRTSHALGPTIISVGGELGGGDTTLAVPPLGTISANTHFSPLSLSLMVTEFDARGLARAVGSSQRDRLIPLIIRDLRAGATKAAFRFFIGGAVLGALLAALLPGRRWQSIAAGATGGGAGVSTVLLLTTVTFNVEAFREPSFTGALRRAPQLLEAVEREIESFEELSSRFEQAAERLSRVLTLLAEPSPFATENSTAILHISDVHSNPVGLEIAAQLVRHFGVVAVLDTGDLTSFGDPIEAQIAQRVARLQVPYIFIPGNHDSSLNRLALDKAANVTLLDERTTDVGDLEILGWADPVVTSFGDISTEEGNEVRIEEAERVAEAVSDSAPDVLAVHDQRLAVDAVGEVPLVLAGHTHVRSFEEEGETVMMTVGSTGATGLGSFLVESEARYEAQVLYFREGRLAVYDYISFTGLAGDFTVERRTVIQD